MAIKTLYTAVGRFERRTNGCNRSCPIILLGGQEYMVDMQEMVIWSMLNWRILRWDDIAQEYEKLSTASGYCTERSWEDCTNRLLTRGLLVSGSGETEYDALYDLLGSLSIIPTSGPFFLRLASFVKLTLLAHVPVSAARKLFQKDKRTKYEALVMRLAGQALLSTAEIIKCIDKNISRLPNECALLDSLYGDETTTSDNIASMVKISQSSKPVTLAVANLYLRQQIIPSFLFLSRLRKSFTQEWGEAYRRKIPAVIHIEVCAFALAVQFHHIRWSQRTTSVIFRQMLIKVQEQAPQHFHVILPLWATDLCAPYRLIGGGRRLFISSLM